MNNEEKILAILTQMQEDISGLKDGQTRLESRMDHLQEAQEQMQDHIKGLKDTQEQMQSTLTRVALTQENIVLKGLDALAEGQDITHQRLKELARKEEVAELRDEVQILRTVVAQNTRDIAELKAAQ